MGPPSALQAHQDRLAHRDRKARKACLAHKERLVHLARQAAQRDPPAHRGRQVQLALLAHLAFRVPPAQPARKALRVVEVLALLDHKAHQDRWAFQALLAGLPARKALPDRKALLVALQDRKAP